MTPRNSVIVARPTVNAVLTIVPCAACVRSVPPRTSMSRVDVLIRDLVSQRAPTAPQAGQLAVHARPDGYVQAAQALGAAAQPPGRHPLHRAGLPRPALQPPHARRRHV